MKKVPIKERIIFCLRGVAVVLGVLLSVIGVLLCFSITWMFKTWSNLTMDELVYHMTAPLEGTNKGMLVDYFDNCVVGTVIFLLVVVILLIQFRKNKKLYYSVAGGVTVLSLVVAGFFVGNAWKELDISDYTSNRGTYSDFFDLHYTDPREVGITFPETKRNLIYIYLESMEVTYTDTEDGGAFKEGCIPELTQLAQENEDFSGADDITLNGGYSLPGTTWTVAAMFAQSSGIPLNISIDDNAMDTQNSFFSDAITIGDILSSAGYNQTLLIGSDATFGGRRLLFTEHGNYNIMDYNYAKEQEWIPQDYNVWWGYEDTKLIDNAKKQLLEMADGEEPFNLTMLTVDTHFEDGYVCDECPDTFGDNQYANVMACSSSQIGQFIQWIQQQDFYENTTIVISGDHPTMDSDFCESVSDEYTRKVYTAYINSAVECETSDRRNFSTFDDFPTTLAAMGVQIEGNRLGLGTNLFSTEPTLTERFGIDTVSKELSKKSQKLEELASIEKTEDVQLNEEPEVQENATASVASGDYSYDTSALPVYVWDIQGVDTQVESVVIAAWHDEDQSDLLWIQAEMQEDGSYIGYVNIQNFEYKTGQYYIDVYIVDSNGEQRMVGNTYGVVE